MLEEQPRWSADEESGEANGKPLKALIAVGALGALGVFVVVIVAGYVPPELAIDEPQRKFTFLNDSDGDSADARSLTLWWSDFPSELRDVSWQAQPDTPSNIHPQDYAGADSCRECHSKNYESWSQHPHRWMNALADESTVKGDFSDREINYLGGEATFFRRDGSYRMQLVREDTRTFIITQTIGSRFFQYYIGKQVDGPSARQDTYDKDHVLPFGYWLGPGEWVPAVHVFEEQEVPDGARMDPFDVRSYSKDFSVYSDGCNACHTTFAMGDLLCGNFDQMARAVPRKLHWSLVRYLTDVRTKWLSARPESYSADQVMDLLNAIDGVEAPTDAVTLGISCEACHLGSREHVEDPRKPPKFFPHSPYLRVEGGGKPVDLGRSHENVNWACGRCHTGNRPQYAGGMSTWNSTEYSDAMRGSCYSQLRCIDCHNPHQRIGPKWTRSPIQDDASCVRCHQQYESQAAQAAHSHHPVGSEGSRCMNCHMPRLNEGMQDVVRTHTISSPANAGMIYANHPNACNQCHTDKSIQWTVEHLGQWYDTDFSAQQLDSAVTDDQQPAAIGWLKSDNEAVRLVGADCLFRTNAVWALDDLIGALDDPFLINRQFARRGLEQMLGIQLEAYGYRFYMTPAERAKPIADLRKALVEGIR